MWSFLICRHVLVSPYSNDSSEGVMGCSALHKCLHHYRTLPIGITWDWEPMDRKDEQAALICRKQKCELHVEDRQKRAENGKQILQSQVTYVIVIEVLWHLRNLGFEREEPCKLSKKVPKLEFPPNSPPRQPQWVDVPKNNSQGSSESIKALSTLRKKLAVFFSLRNVKGDLKMASELRSTLQSCGSLWHINLTTPSKLNDSSISAKLQIVCSKNSYATRATYQFATKEPALEKVYWVTVGNSLFSIFVLKRKLESL